MLFALLLPVLLGALALGVELSLWYLRQRDMQNAADATVLAASLNNSPAYAIEGAAVATRHGYDGSAVSIVAAQTCPASAGEYAGQASCYRATINNALQLLVIPVLGVAGGRVTDPCLFGNCGGTAPPGSAVLLHASAMATRTELRMYCLLALAAAGGTGIDGRGSSMANLSGCDIMSNGDARCTGHDLGADHGDAAGMNDGCGVIRESNVPPIRDPYQRLASSIPAVTCGGYPQIPAKKGGAGTLPAENRWSGVKSWSGNQIVCGDLQLVGNVTISNSPNATLVIVNGQLDLNGFTLTTGHGSGVTVVFTGTSGGTYTHTPTGDGTLDITAPNSGAWSGIAVYQDPALTRGVDIYAAGNSPNWKITGLVYLPHAAVDIRGAVSKATNGLSCFGLVVDTIDVRGTAAIYPRFDEDCKAAHIELPQRVIRGKLVQ